MKNMTKKHFFLFYLLILSGLNVKAQRGLITIDPNIASTQTVNEYTAVTADLTAGATTISVVNSALNTNNRFLAGGLSAGDLIMIIQMQGVGLNLTIDPGNANLSLPKDSTWGTITSYGNSGNYEFAQVASVPNNTSIVIDCGLQKNYTASGKVQVVRVPRYKALTIAAAGVLTCDAWNGTTGGVVAVEVLGITSIAGKIDVSGKGFRGGGRHEANCLDHELEVWGMSAYMDVGMQGESVAGDSISYTTIGAKYGRGAPANGGGGGSNKSCGGGGGANAGDPVLYSGNGNPDNSIANYITAWNLEYSGFASSSSSGGGRGGYGASTGNGNPLTDAPTSTNWGSSPFRRVNKGGRGGRPLDYSTGRVFLGGGGGGGCGDRARSNTDARTGGANGGGLIYLLTYDAVNGSGQVLSNGNAVTQTTRDDGAGGGGAGGTILINAKGTISNTLSVQAKGGKGGDQVVPTSFGVKAIEAEGPGGGGGGGYISISGGSVTANVTGGTNGTTDARGFPNFPANGATKGGNGIYNNTLVNFPEIISSNTTVCPGGTATLTASLNNDPGGSTINWYDAPKGGNLLGTGTTYTVNNVTSQQIIYAGFCTGTYRIADTIKLYTPSPINAGIDTAVCLGDSVQLNVSGAVSYSWTPSSGLSADNVSNPKASPAAPTTYIVFGTDNHGCIATDTVKVNVKSKPNIAINANPTSICQGQTVSLQASGAVTYTWSTSGNSNFSNSATVSVHPSSTVVYTLLGIGSNGCTKTVTQNITVTSAPAIIVSNTHPVNLCPGDSVTLNVTGGFGTFTWLPATGLNQINGNAVTAKPTVNTLYTVTSSDGICTAEDTVSVFVKTPTTVTFSPAAPTICQGQTATINANGGNNYTWFSPSGINLGNGNPLSVTPLSDSTYQLHYLSSGCPLTSSVTVTVGSTINVVAIASKDTVCLGTSATLTALNGGNFTWTASPTLSSTTGNTVTATPTATTVYTVTGGSGLCTDTGMVKVIVTHNTISINPANATICKGSNVSIIASGSATYSWSNGQTDSSIIVQPIVNTTYTVIGSSAGLCPATGTVTISVDTAKIKIQGNTATCQGQTVNLTASNGSNFSWSTGQSTTSINPVVNSTTTYTVFGINLTGCADTAKITVTPTSKPTLTYTGNTVVCSGNSTAITWSGATQYSWQGSGGYSGNNVLTVAPMQTTIYTVFGDFNGCISQDTITVKANPAPHITGSSAKNLCKGNSVTLSVNGSPNYTWSPQTNLTLSNDSIVQASPTSTVTYTVTGGIAACKDTFYITVNVDPNPVNLTVTATKDSVCSGVSSTLNATGASNFSWTPTASLSTTTGGSVSATPLNTTQYTVVGYNQFCADTSTIKIAVLNTPSVTVTPTQVNICAGNSTVLTASGNAPNYSWIPTTGLSSSNTANVSANPASTITYTVVGYNAICSDSDFVSVNVSNSLTVTTNFTDTTLCNGESASIIASGAPSYSWAPTSGLSASSGSTVTASPTANTIYSVIGYNQSCSDTAIVNVKVSPSISLSVSASQTTICTGDQTTLTATANTTNFSWVPSPDLSSTVGAIVTASPVSSKNYTVTAWLGRCYETKSINIQVLSGLNVTATAAPSKVCEGESTQLTANGATNYVWLNNSQNTSSISVSPTSTMQYTVVGSTGSCKDTAYITAGVYPPPIVTAEKNQTIAAGTEVTISATGAGTYQWSPNDGIVSCGNCANAVVQPTVTTTYTVTGTDVNGCTGTSSVTITIDNNYAIFIPSAFSPNGDGENDVLYVRGRGIKELKFLIFNAWGEKVFESVSPSIGWDGKRHGIDLNSGVFVYQVSGEFYNGQSFKQKGDVTLIR